MVNCHIVTGDKRQVNFRGHAVVFASIPPISLDDRGETASDDASPDASQKQNRSQQASLAIPFEMAAHSR